MSTTTTNSTSPLYNQIHATSLKYIQSFSDARTLGTTTALNGACAPNCKRFYSPISLTTMLPPSFATGEPNDTYATRMQVEFDQTVGSKDPEIRVLVIDERARKSAVNVTLFNRSKTTGKEYPFEFAFFFDLGEQEDGGLIERVQVFADVGMAKMFFEDEREIAAATVAS